MAGWTKNLLDSQQGLGLFATAVAGIVPHIMSLGGALSKVGDVYMAAKGAKGILGVGKSLVSRVSGGGSADAATTAGGDAAVTTTAAEVGGDAAAAGGTGAAAAVGTVALPVAAIAGLTWLSMHVGNQNRDTTGIGYHGPSAKQLGKMDHVPKVNYSQISKLTQDLSTPAMQADLKAIVAQQQAEGKGDPPTGSTSTMGMTGAMKQRVSAMMAANPNLKISSGHRTSSQQAYLYAAKGGQGVARPGQSAHQSGKAADMGPPSQFGWIAKNASKFGLSRPAPRSEPWHVQVMGDPAATVTGAQVVSGAEAQEGSNYVWGGSTPGSFDCSGLVQYVYKQLGITLPRTSQAQANAGTAVQGIGSAQPGDLIFYNEPGEGPNSHVAIYIGGGKQVEAAHTGTVVAINPIDTPHLSCIRRIVGGGAGSAAAAGAQSTVGATSNDAASHAIAAAAPTSMSNSFLAGVASLGGMSGGGGGGILAGALPGGGSVGAAAGSGTATTGTATTGTTPPGTAGSVVSAVKAVTSNRNVQLAMLTGSSLESNQNPKAVGAGSYGAWQIQMLSGRNVTQAQAEDPNFAAKFMVGQYTSAMNAVPSSLWTTNGAQAAEQVAYAAERPAETYFASQGAARVASAYATAVSEVGPPIAMGDPVGTMSGMGGAGSVSGGGGMGGGNTYHLHMPVQVANATQQDAQRLVSMVLAELKTQAGIDAMSGG
jgi:cell wall-associated NlpC family hydrolase